MSRHRPWVAKAAHAPLTVPDRPPAPEGRPGTPVSPLHLPGRSAQRGDPVSSCPLYGGCSHGLAATFAVTKRPFGTARKLWAPAVREAWSPCPPPSLGQTKPRQGHEDQRGAGGPLSCPGWGHSVSVQTRQDIRVKRAWFLYIAHTSTKQKSKKKKKKPAMPPTVTSGATSGVWCLSPTHTGSSAGASRGR